MKKLFITGGNGDIGSAIKNKFQKEGFTIIAPTRNEINLESQESIEKYFKKIDCNFDVLVHCAGYNCPDYIENLPIEEMIKTVQINVFSFFQILKYFIPEFKKKKRGHILGISSLYGTVARDGRCGYTMSKHAMNGLMKTVAIELGEYNIKVNNLSPGYVDTKLTRKNNDDKKIKSFEAKIPLDRLASTEDIANVAYFLCSNENNYINGQDIIVDGGFMAGGFNK